MKPDIHNDNAWFKMGSACWGFGARRVDPRLPSFSGVHDVLAAISCVGPDAWVIYIHGEHRAQVESWDEAKSIAAVLLNSKEME